LEYIFYILIAALVVGYLIDPKGFKSTGKRIVTIVRSNIEAGMPVKQIEPTKAHDEWEQQFKEIENPQPLVPVEKPKKHAIVKHTYYNAGSQGAWPQWICKCGQRGHVPIGIWSERETLQRARNEGQQHVTSMNKADELLSKTNGDFAW
jgi:hypothetical protein